MDGLGARAVSRQDRPSDKKDGSPTRMCKEKGEEA
jgi:hypothetical protein